MLQEEINILVVEDNPDDVMLLRAMLTEEPSLRATLTVAGTLEEASRMLDSTSFAAVLLDLHLPDSQGMDTFHTLSQHAPNVPIIVVTVMDLQDTGIEAVRSGAQDYLVKDHLTGPLVARAVRYGIERMATQAELLAARDQLEERVAEQVQEIAASGKRYKALVEQLQEGIWEIDAQGKTTFVNPSMARLLGYAPEEMEGKLFFDFMDKQMAKACGHSIQHTKGGANEECEIRFIHKDGTNVFAYVSTKPFYDEAGRYSGALSAAMDISGRKQAEAEIESQARFPRENPNPILRVHHDGTLLYANEAATDLLKSFKMESPDFIGANFCDRLLMGCGDHDLCRKELEIDNKIYDLAIASKPGVGYINIYGMDITDRVKVERENKIHAEKISKQMSEVFQLYENTPLGMCLVDSELRYIRINSILANIHGVAPQAHLGRGIQDVLDEQALGTLLPIYKQVLASGEISTSEFEGLYCENAEEKKWWSVTVYPVKASHQEVFALGTLVRDITAEKEAHSLILNSRNMIKGLMDAAPDRFLLTDTQGTVLALNKTAAESWGMNPAEMVGKNLFHMHPTELHDSRIHSVHKVLETAHPAQIIDERDGIILETNLHPVLDDAGQVTQLAIFSKNITEQRKAEQSLKFELKVTRALSRLYAPLIAPESDILDVTQTLLDEAKLLTGSTAGHVGTIDPDSGDLVVHTYTRMLGEACPIIEPDARRITFPRNPDGTYTSLLGHSLNTCAPHFTNDPAEHSAATGLPNGHEPIDNYLGLPVLLGNRLVGQIALANKPGGFDRKDVEAVSRLGEFFALAIQRRIAMEELRASEKRYKSLYQAMHDGFVTTNMEGRITEANDSFAKMVGYSQDELRSMTMEDLTPENWHGQEKFIVRRQVLPRGYSDLYDKEITSKQDKLVAVSVRTQLIRDEAGEPSGMWSSIRDVTERRNAEMALRISEEKLREAQKLAHLGHWELDIPTGVLSLSREVRLILGLPPGRDIKTRDAFLGFIHPEDRPEVARLFKDSIEHKKHYVADYRIIQPSGNIRHVHAESRTDYGFDNQPLRTMGMIQDITGRKQAENKTKEYADLLRAILEGIQAAVFIIDLESHKVVEVNSIAQELIGISQDDLVGASCQTVLKMKGKFHPCIDLDTAVINQEDELEKPDGTVVPVLRSILPITLDGKKHIVETTFDLTDRKKLESQLMLAQKMESIGQLSAGIAHEINTPMQYIGDNIRFLQDAWNDAMPLLSNCQELACLDVDDEETQEQTCEALKNAWESGDISFHMEEAPNAFEQTIEGVERVVAIVQAMKRFSHPGEDEMKLADINNALQNTAVVSRNEWKYHADIEYDLSPDLPPVPCFLNDLNQVFLNIIVNAAHAIAEKNAGTDQKGTITIATSQDANTAQIRISDTGTGISEENISRVFDHFFTTKEVGKGTGQGLSLAYSIVADKHHGTINVESREGHGATFLIRLPLGEGG